MNSRALAQPTALATSAILSGSLILSLAVMKAVIAVMVGA